MNNVKIGKKRIYYQWPSCDVHEWHINDATLLKKINLKKGVNTISFEIDKSSKCKSGMSIYYKALDKKLKNTEVPIIVEIN